MLSKGPFMSSGTQIEVWKLKVTTEHPTARFLNMWLTEFFLFTFHSFIQQSLTVPTLQPPKTQRSSWRVQARSTFVTLPWK